MHWIASLQAPGESQTVVLPEGAAWIHALDYRELACARPPADDHLRPDALLRGEIRGDRFIDGSGLGSSAFGAAAGDRVEYVLPPMAAGGELLLQYQARGPVTIRMEGAVNSRFSLAPSGSPQSLTVPDGAGELRIVSEGGAALEIHGIVLARPGTAARVRFEAARFDPVPEISQPAEGSILLKYGPLPHAYGLAWKPSPHRMREILARNLDTVLPFSTDDHVARVLRGEGNGHFTDVITAPLILQPGARGLMHALVCCGGRGSVSGELARFSAESAERAHAPARSRRWQPVRAGPFRFSQERLGATVLINVVYPVYARRSFVKHNTPGRFWDSLYTWDSGFTALGLGQMDLRRAIDCLRAYTSAPEDPHYAYVQHGTPLPVLIYAFQELWPRLLDRGLLEQFYPRFRQMYLILAGRAGGSTTRRLSSGFLQTWDYFYNTGWDDYPAQVCMHEQKLAPIAATAAINSHLVRCAKTLSLMAAALGRESDSGIFAEDIAAFSAALQKHSWDAEAGCFSYVLHDARGAAAGFLRHASGQNFNLGLDGASPSSPAPAIAGSRSCSSAA